MASVGKAGVGPDYWPTGLGGCGTESCGAFWPRVGDSVVFVVHNEVPRVKA